MTLKDYLSIAAILVSIAGFAVATWGATFNRRLKAAELRVSLLSKLTEITIRAEKFRVSQMALSQSATAKGASAEIMQAIDDLSAEGIMSVAHSIYADISKKTAKDVFAYHESYFHELHKASELVQSLEHRVSALKERLDRAPHAPAAA